MDRRAMGGAKGGTREVGVMSSLRANDKVALAALSRTSLASEEHSLLAMTLPSQNRQSSLLHFTLKDRLFWVMILRDEAAMAMRAFLSIMAAGALMCGAISATSAQSSKGKAAPAKQVPVKQAPAKQTPATPPAAATGGAEPTLVGQFGTWGAYTAAPNGRKVCFALAKPSSSKTNPPNRPRDPAYAFVSTRPSEKVNNEVSIMIGYQLKPGSESTLVVGGATFAMYTQGDGIWIKNAADEERMVEAMRKAADATVKGVSSKGTETTDTFVLKGLAQALDKLGQTCR